MHKPWDEANFTVNYIKNIEKFWVHPKWPLQLKRCQQKQSFVIAHSLTPDKLKKCHEEFSNNG